MKEPVAMVLWIAITADKYELPLIVADTPEELAQLAGVAVGSVRSCYSRYKNGRRKKSRYICVEIPDEIYDL